MPHVERCEVVRHCRWVDEVIPDAPWMLEKDQLVQWRINYVAFDEGTSIDPAFDKTRLQAYDALKSMGTSTVASP
jgi:glycerol-3-phosphate cytidylyltransferase-like family protein